MRSFASRLTLLRRAAISLALLPLTVLVLACARPIGADNVAPEADAGGDRFVELDTPTTFDASASADPDGTLISFTWSFPDGEAQGAVVEYTFETAGRYVVALTVVDDLGAEDRVEIIVTVTGAAPVIEIDVSEPSDVRLFQEVVFDGSGTTSREPIVAWRWSFGDGVTASGAQVTHFYERTGTFIVRLEVEDALGTLGELTRDLQVLPLDVAGTWTLSASPSTFACASYDAAFAEESLTLTVEDDGVTLAGTSTSGALFSGTLDDDSFQLQADHVVSTGASCPAAPATTTISATLQTSSMTSMTGAIAGFEAQVTRWYDLAVPCQCSALFMVSGSR